MSSKKIMKYGSLLGIFLLVYYLLVYYLFIFNNISTHYEVRFNIYKNENFIKVFKKLKKSKILKNSSTFYIFHKIINPRGKIYIGSYVIKPNTSNYKLIQMLKKGLQTPLRVTITNIENKNELIETLCKKLYIDKRELELLLKDNDFLKKYGFNSENILTLFIPNTYYIYWNTSICKLIERFFKEHNKFWNEERLRKSKMLRLTRAHISILASLVQSETIVRDEYRTIAGLLINRIKMKMPLQSDPTLKFANNIPKVNRVLEKDKKIDSPYNTYKYRGLPPGPICLPTICAIDSVLDYEKNNFLYMSAIGDSSGRHNFTKSFKQHLNFARKYQKILNKRRIFR